MAILVDANQIAISHLMVRHKIEDGINIDSIRKSIVRVMGRIDKKFRDEYGQMILCYDDKNYWRREVFPFYKKNRKQERETSKYDWISAELRPELCRYRYRSIENEDPVHFLQEHIIRGDRSDGIPNILTCDDAIVTGKPQKKMSKEKIAHMASLRPDEFTNYIRLRNWKRNSELIDLTKIPRPVVERILTYFRKKPTRTTVSIDYFIENKLQEILPEFS